MPCCDSTVLYGKVGEIEDVIDINVLKMKLFLGVVILREVVVAINMFL
jgi:hypothetical protein